MSLLSFVRTIQLPANKFFSRCLFASVMLFTANAIYAKPVEAEGELEVLIEDHADFARTRHYLKTDKGRIELQYKGKAPDLHGGAKLRVIGEHTNNVMYLSDSGAASLAVTAAAPLPNTFGEQRAVVLMVNFQDDSSQPFTTAQVNDVIFTQTSNFVRENSFQQTWLAGNTFNWITLPVAKTCDGMEIASRTQSAATAAGIDLSTYGKFIYVFPYNATCGWAASATVGGTIPRLWVNGKLDVRVIGHEFGHVFGLLHSHAQECGTTTLGAACTSLEYGDTVDIMGNNVAGHFNAIHKERLGWLNSGTQPPITTVQATGTYSIDAYAAASTKPKALKILKSVDAITGAKTWFYVEYRAAVGYDSVMSGIYGTNIPNGVVVRVGSDSDGNSSSLLDMTPNSSFYTDWFDPALAFGQVFTDAASGVMITAVSGNGASAQVNISLSQTMACARVNPVVAITGGGQSVAAGTPQAYTVSVTNKDSVACGASTFTLQAAVPAGWSGGYTNTSLSVSPGAVMSTTLNVASPTVAVPGTYPVGATALNATAAGYSSSASASYAIAGLLSTAVTTNQTSYLLGDSIIASAKIGSGSSALANVNVTFVFTQPNGTLVTKSAISDSAGIARTSYRVARKDPAGVWILKGSASYSGSSTSGSSGFTVR